MPRRTVFHRAVLAAVVILAAFLFTGTGYGAESIEHEFSGSLDVDGRWYPQTGAHPEQRAHASGFAVEPKLHLESGGNWSFTIAPFFRYDGADSRRTRADLREAYLLMLGEAGEGEWELRLGVDRVFWGVTESQHLVDIINQTDLVEHPNKESKLGQPMAHLTWSAEWGILEFFALTYHRARTYTGPHGRLRSSIPIDDEHVSYESAAGEWRVDLAARYSHSFGPFDIGLSVFDGTSREPFVTPHIDERGAVSLRQHYEPILQFSVDAQLTIEAWLLKLEALHRAGARNLLGMEEDFAAFVVGGGVHLQRRFRLCRRPRPARRMELRRAARAFELRVPERPLLRRSPGTQRRPEHGDHRRRPRGRGPFHTHHELRIETPPLGPVVHEARSDCFHGRG